MVSQASAMKIGPFHGINTRENESVIKDNELVTATNVDLGRAGELTKRTGFVQLHNGSTLGAVPCRILGHFLTDTYSQIIVATATGVYYSTDGTTFTLLSAITDAQHAVQYNSIFYIIRSTTTITQWTGVVATQITGSPFGTFAIMYKDRMYVINSAAAGALNSRFYFSKAGDVTATGWISTNFIDVGPGDGDFLVCMAIIRDLLVIFKGKSTWALYVQGTIADWALRSLNLNIGCISKNAVRLIEGFLYISSSVAVYRTDGTSFEDISAPIQPVLKDRIVNLTTYNVDSFAYWQDKLICLLAPDTTTRVYYVFHLKVGGWTKWEFGTSMKPWTFVEIRTNTPQHGLYCSDNSSTGNVFRYGDTTVFTDVGSSYQVDIKTKFFDMDAPTNMKRGKWALLDMLGVGTVNWYHSVDSSGVIRSGSVASIATRSGLKIAGPGYFRRWQLEITTTSSVNFLFISALLEVDAHRTLILAGT